MKKHGDGEEKVLGIKIFWLLVGLAVAVWIVWFFVSLFFISEKSGQFGDTFGAFNALVSAIAIAGVVYAILQQREDLNLQKRALDLQHQELELVRQEMIQSNKYLAEQLKKMDESYQFTKTKAELESEPKFEPAGGSLSDDRKSLNIINRGARIVDVGISFVEPEPYLRLGHDNQSVLETDGSLKIKITGFTNYECPKLIFTISYTTVLGVRGKASFLAKEGRTTEMVRIDTADNT